jgi:type VI secretion system secreted protein Hcp
MKSKNSFFTIFFIALSCQLMSLTLVAQRNMIYLKIKGQKQGDIKGEVIERGKEGTIKPLSFEHEIVSPRDAASGLPTGKRQHKPLSITKMMDKASPMLYNALVTNENLTEVNINFYRPSNSNTGGVGANEMFYSIKLTNANISAIKTITKEDGTIIEAVFFTYQKIAWTFTNGGIFAEDDW